MNNTKTFDPARHAAACRRRSVAELLFVAEDCRATLAAWPDHPNAGYYAAEAAACRAELDRREAGGRRVTPARACSRISRPHVL